MTKKIAIAGLGTVGSHVLNMLQHMQHDNIEIVAISARTKNKDRLCDISNMAFYDNPLRMLQEKKPDILVELIGGSDGIVEDIWHHALDNNINIITANKAILAEKGKSLIKKARDNHVMIAYEAAVAGAIPIIKILREALSGTYVNGISGILNGTCNYILSQMRLYKQDFVTALKQAQNAGYAESDPTFDIDGIDAAHKLLLLTAITFGEFLTIDDIECDGIRHIDLVDIIVAENLGYRIKLIGSAQRSHHGIKLRISPYLVPKDHALYHIENAINAVVIDGKESGPISITGYGAGGSETASSVIADIVNIALGNTHIDILGSRLQPKIDQKNLPDFNNLSYEYYIRVTCYDKIGVMAQLAQIFQQHHISIKSMTQYGDEKDKPVDLEFITHELDHNNDLKQAIDVMNNCDIVLKPVILLPIL